MATISSIKPQFVCPVRRCSCRTPGVADVVGQAPSQSLALADVGRQLEEWRCSHESPDRSRCRHPGPLQGRRRSPAERRRMAGRPGQAGERSDKPPPVGCRAYARPRARLRKARGAIARRSMRLRAFAFPRRHEGISGRPVIQRPGLASTRRTTSAMRWRLRQPLGRRGRHRNTTAT